MIDIAELLKNASYGTELWCTLYGKVYLISIDPNKRYPIQIKLNDSTKVRLDRYGKYYDNFEGGECVLFPSKDCRTWEGWKLPVEPKFKAGDKALYDMMIVTVKDVVYDQKYKEYRYSVGSYWVFESALKPYKSHYDISYFKPKQWVLVRDDDEWEWTLTRFSHLSNGSASLFVCINGASFQQCIPFDENERLLGTTDMCPEEYVNW